MIYNIYYGINIKIIKGGIILEEMKIINEYVEKISAEIDAFKESIFVCDAIPTISFVESLKLLTLSFIISTFS